MTHGHELRLGSASGRGDAGWRGVKGWKKWENYNSIINKIYLKIKKNKKKKKIQKNKAKEPLAQLETYQHSNHTGARRKGERTRN